MNEWMNNLKPLRLKEIKNWEIYVNSLLAPFIQKWQFKSKEKYVGNTERSDSFCNLNEIQLDFVECIIGFG